MRALIRRIVDFVLGCRPKQVARRRDLYGWSVTPQNDNNTSNDKEN